jgi:hypothetical protein
MSTQNEKVKEEFREIIMAVDDDLKEFLINNFPYKAEETLDSTAI